MAPQAYLMTLATVSMLLLLLLLLGASAFFSGSETALFSLTRHQRARLQRDPAVVARTLHTLLEETRALLITLLLGNMLVNVLYFAVSSALMLQIGRHAGLPGWALAPLALVPLLAIILFGEVLPKLTAARLPEGYARTVAIPLLAVHRAVSPVRRFASAVVIGPLARLLAPGLATPHLGPEDLAAMLDLSRRRGVIDHDEQRVLDQVLALGRLRVRHLTVPRVDVRAFNLDDDPAALRRLVAETRLRHIPAFRGDLDHPQGLLYSKEVLLRDPQTPADVAALVRPVKFIPDLQRADRALLDLRRSGTTFALVVDEYGGTAGLITLEDLVEHLVGEIPGAYEPVGAPRVRAHGAGRFSVDADLPAADWLQPLGVAAADDRSAAGGASTVGGLVMAQLGRVAIRGDAVTLGAVRLTVEAVDGHRIQTVGVELRSRTAPPSGPQAGASAHVTPNHKGASQ